MIQDTIIFSLILRMTKMSSRATKIILPRETPTYLKHCCGLWNRNSAIYMPLIKSSLPVLLDVYSYML